MRGFENRGRRGTLIVGRNEIEGNSRSRPRAATCVAELGGRSLRYVSPLVGKQRRQLFPCLAITLSLILS